MRRRIRHSKGGGGRQKREGLKRDGGGYWGVFADASHASGHRNGYVIKKKGRQALCRSLN